VFEFFFFTRLIFYQGVCYITNASFIGDVRKEWEKRSNNAIVDYVVVPQLPKSALVEWQVWVHRANTRFECK
jgi:diphthine-ammonia ligase